MFLELFCSMQCDLIGQCLCVFTTWGTTGCHKVSTACASFETPSVSLSRISSPTSHACFHQLSIIDAFGLSGQLAQQSDRGEPQICFVGMQTELLTT